jgi:hypothetical protein
MKITVLWEVQLCGLEQIYTRFGDNILPLSLLKGSAGRMLCEHENVSSVSTKLKNFGFHIKTIMNLHGF